MKTLSLKLDDHIFEETEQVTGYLKKSRNRYINEALEHYNKLQKRALLSARLAEESKLVGKESMDILKEFEMLGDESEAI
jgi:hypothetical protein